LFEQEGNGTQGREPKVKRKTKERGKNGGFPKTKGGGGVANGEGRVDKKKEGGAGGKISKKM